LFDPKRKGKLRENFFFGFYEDDEEKNYEDAEG